MATFLLLPAGPVAWAARTVLVSLSALLACTSSSPRPAPTPSTDFAQLEARFPSSFLARGRTVYLRQCVTCHQADGLGTGAAIPPLAKHLPRLAAAPNGRAYLANIGLYGLTGKIEVLGRTYYNVMPSQGSLLTNEDLAGAFNYALTQWGNDAQVTEAMLLRPEDVAAARAHRHDAAETLQLRPVLQP